MIVTIKKLDVRVRSFCSIKNAEFELNDMNLIMGYNNAGKTNVLRALELGLGYGDDQVSPADIFIAEGERLTADKHALIDIKLEFDDSDYLDAWLDNLPHDFYGVVDIAGRQLVAIRTIIEFDETENRFVVKRFALNNWGVSIETSSLGASLASSEQLREVIKVFYLGSNRDIVNDLKDSHSYIRRSINVMAVDPHQAQIIESSLNQANEQVIGGLPSLKQLAHRITPSGGAIVASSRNSKLVLDAVPGSLDEAQHHLGLSFKDGVQAPLLPIARHGSGTRSSISLLSLNHYIKMMQESDEALIAAVLLIEQPESDLHPQGQQQLYQHITDFAGLKVVTTHSPYLLAQAALTDLVHIEKNESGCTTLYRLNAYDFEGQQLDRIKRDVVRSHGEMFFTPALILCEGKTETESLPIFSQAMFGEAALSFCFVEVGGLNYEPYLQMAHTFGLNWFIFSDGEAQAIKAVNNAVTKVFGVDFQERSRIIILENGENWEQHLLNNGYQELIVSAICEYEEDDDYLLKFIKHSRASKPKRIKTDQICDKCGQYIYVDVDAGQSNYVDDDEGIRKAVLDCCTKKKAKAQYAAPIAQSIVTLADEGYKYPPKVKQLLEQIASSLKW